MQFFDWLYLTPNLIMYTIWFLMAWIITKSPRRGAICSTIFSYLFNLIAHYVFRFRGRGLLAIDLFSIKTAMSVAGDFSYTPDMAILMSMILSISYIVLVWKVCPRTCQKLSPVKWKNAFISIVVFAIPIIIVCTPIMRTIGIFPYLWNTEQDGTMFNFLLSFNNIKLEEPSEYSTEKVNQIVSQYKSEAGNKEIQPENIIVIMDESFCDYSIFPGFTASEDPYEFIHSLDENTISGTLYVPVYGGGTANTEYEVLTGLSMQFTPNTVPYLFFHNNQMPALSSLAAEEGYQTIAFHPYKETGWNRKTVYQEMSFSSQLYEDDVIDPYIIRNLISDKSDFEKIYEITDETTSKCFCFNVTMQNHGGYDKPWHNLTKSISTTDELEHLSPGFTQYLCLADATDEAIKNLISHYSSCPERTMIVLFGDHHPPVSDSIYEELMQKETSDWTKQDAMQQFLVPFFIWANYDIEEKQDVIISSNYLSLLIAETAGLPTTGFMGFLSEIQKEFPVISEQFIVDKNGNYYSSAHELPEDLYEKYMEYYFLNYAALSDNSSQYQSFFRHQY